MDSANNAPMPVAHRRVIAASALGALFEWYDFFLYGALAPVLAARFFAPLDERAALPLALLAFAAGFIVRPLGALLFGRLGDLLGRKYTFLLTLLLMGASTFAVGLLPGHAAIGAAAPALLLMLRLLQGLAIGGEYGGVVTYVAEHAPRGRRGLYTGWVQMTATLGLLLALLVIGGLRAVLDAQAFDDWGWRVPFLLSVVLLVIGVWVRLALQESPGFLALKQSGGTARRPLTEAFGRWPNLRRVLLALFGLVAAQAVIWYAGQFQALYYLTLALHVDEAIASVLVAVALALGAPLILVAAALSDRVGRKPVFVAGCALAALSTIPLYAALADAANPALVRAQARVVVTLHGDALACAPGLAGFDVATPCGAVRQRLTARAVRHAWQPGGDGPDAHAVIDGRRVSLADAGAPQRLDEALDAAGYPRRADPAGIDRLRVVALLLALLLPVALVYGPLAAMLVELFPARIRCSSVSLPYHVGNGWFGGLLPSIGLAIGARTGDGLDALWYPVAIAAVGGLVAFVFMPETRARELFGAAD